MKFPESRVRKEGAERPVTITGVQPYDSNELVLWHLEIVNNYRMARKPAKSYQFRVRQLMRAARQAFYEWLGKNKPELQHVGCVNIVVPYLAFRLMKTPATRALMLTPISKGQRFKFLDDFLRNLYYRKGASFVRRKGEVDMRLLEAFFRSLYWLRVH